MISSRIVEYVFFFGLMGIVAYIISPFVSALALSAIIVTICYPMYERIILYTPRKNKAIAAFATTFTVLVIVIIPFLFITSQLFTEASVIFNTLRNDPEILQTKLLAFERVVHTVAPNYQFDVLNLIKQGADFASNKFGSFVAGTATTAFMFFIAMIGTYYFFKDGKVMTKRLVVISPLPDNQDEKILARLAQAVRSVALGSILVALIQGFLTAVGLWMFGFERAVLWGTIAAFGALIPGIGTAIVFVPAVIYLGALGDYLNMVLLIAYGTVIVGLVDNLLGPYLKTRGNNMHPFLMLISVLGGIAFLGPIGFIVGPVMVSLLLVLLELYNSHISQ